MGIGPHAIKLTRIIGDARILNPSFSVLELGSQDFAPTLSIAQAAIGDEFGYENPERFKTPPDLYEAMGSELYECIDLDGKHGAHVFDLNHDLSEKYGFKKKFDLVTNHGTTEHLFNQLAAFENVHRLSAKGGVMLHALPFQGYQNHGMFNYNPSLFLDLAQANNYEIFGLFLSIDDKLYQYDEDFLARNGISATQDCLVMAVLIKKSEAPFQAPYDGRYFSMRGRESISALKNHIGTTKRSLGGEGHVFEGLDELYAAGPDYNDRQYRFITPLWGKSYVSDYLGVTLPSQLSKENLRAFRSEESVYTIVTTGHDAEEIKSSPRFTELSKLMPVEFILHTQLSNEDPYVRMSRAYNLALARVSVPQVCFFLTGDDFYSDGLLGTAKNIIDGGKLVVMVPTVRVVTSSFRAEVELSGKPTREAGETVRLILRHEHPMATACVVNDKACLMHRLPAQTLHRLKDGYVGRWNVTHPLAIKLRANPPLIDLTIDWNYPVLNVSRAEDIHIVRDSDEGVIASMSPHTYSQNEEIRRHATRGGRIRTLKDWVDIDWALNFHVLQMSRPVFLHGGVVGPEYEAAISSVDRVWVPFSRYIQRRSVPVPEGAEGYALDLLTRAVMPAPLRRARTLFHQLARRLHRKIRRVIYNRLVRWTSV